MNYHIVVPVDLMVRGSTAAVPVNAKQDPGSEDR
jgi:hypothetical protein